jgi:thiamine-phosphate pyrophosphorylase
MPDKLARTKLARAAARFAAQSGSGLPPLILMTDDERLTDPLAAARALPRGSMVILRARKSAQRESLALALRKIARSHDIKLLIADDPALAARTGAHGIHLPQAHARDAAHWRALRPHWMITAAAHSLSSAVQIRHADAMILAPIFATQSHPGGNMLGALRLRRIAQQMRIPIYALGGITAVTARNLTGAKLAGLAAIGALAV